MTDYLAAALIIIPIGLLVYWWYIVIVNFSQDGNDEQRNDYLKQFKDETETNKHRPN